MRTVFPGWRPLAGKTPRPHEGAGVLGGLASVLHPQPVTAALAGFVLVGVYGALGGLSLDPSAAVGLMAAVAIAWAVRPHEPPRPSLRLLRTMPVVAAAAAAGVLVTNDVYNLDILWQLSLVEQCLYFDRLTIPAFYAPFYSTKYDGWIQLVAVLSSVTGVPPDRLLHHANVVLYPAVVVLLLAACRVFRLRPWHAAALLILLLIGGGDELRLIALAGPRPIATMLQISGLLLLLPALASCDWRDKTRLGAGILCLAASALTHSFFALSNTLICLGLAASHLIQHRRGRPAIVRAASLILGYVVLVGPYVVAKRASVPASQLPGLDEAAAAEPGFSLMALVDPGWGERGGLLVYLLVFTMTLAWAAKGGVAATHEEMRLGRAAFMALLVGPLTLVAMPVVNAILIAIVTESRLGRLLPLNAPVLLWASYASMVAMLRQGWRDGHRPALAGACGVAAALLVPSAIQATQWYAHGWEASRRPLNEDKDYVSAAVFLGVYASRGEHVAASNRLQALKIAAVMRGYRVYFPDEGGGLSYATHVDTFPAGSAVPVRFDLIVDDRSRRREPGLRQAFTSGRLIVYRRAPTETPRDDVQRQP